MILIPLTDCQNSDGLTWGVTEGQEFRYHIVKTSIYRPPPPLSDLHQFESHELSITVPQLPTIPSTLTNYTDLPRVGLVPYIIDFRIASGDSDVLPVGDWTLLQDLDSERWLRRYNSQDLIFKNASYFENSTCWGYSFSYNTMGAYEVEANVSMDCTVMQTKIFNKIDGVLIFRHTSLQFYADNWGSYDFGRIVETAVRIESNPEPDNTIFLILGGGSIVAIVLIILVYKVVTGKR
ncbi:MAG: hypothetical protein RTV31_11995 [Candidatus Thorarchaeota archaeon]